MKKKALITMLLITGLQGIAQDNKINNAQQEAHFYEAGQWANYGNDPGGDQLLPFGSDKS